MDLIILEAANGMSDSSDLSPTPVRSDILFCIKRDGESMLTPNRRLFWGSVLPSWSTGHSLPGNGGNEIECCGTIG